MDSRFLSNYQGNNSFSVKQVREILTTVLLQAEEERDVYADLQHIERLCEQAIDHMWQWARSEVLEQRPPLSVSILHVEPAQAGEGMVHLKTPTGVSQMSKVIEVSGQVSAMQKSIDLKLERNQWGATNRRWLVVVLDDGEAATQLMGATEFNNDESRFEGLRFPGLDEV